MNNEIMPLEEALAHAEEWTNGQTFYPGIQGWRPVCAVLAQAVQDLQSKLATAEGLVALQQEQIADWQRKVGELEADSRRLDAIESECWEVRCIEERNHDDADVRYDVVGFWMSEPNERVLGSGRTPREAIDAALNTETTG